ncbi:MAG: dienelactone hydrolase family protein [Pseudomonadota bacterium]
MTWMKTNRGANLPLAHEWVVRALVMAAMRFCVLDCATRRSLSDPPTLESPKRHFQEPCYLIATRPVRRHITDVSTSRPKWRLSHVSLALLICVALSGLSVSSIARAGVAECSAVLAGHAETVTFEASTSRHGKVKLEAMLAKPSGDRKSAALVVLHGYGGVRPPRCYEEHMERFTNWGYAALLIDSASQITSSGQRVFAYSSEDQTAHALAGAQFLANLSYIDADRLGILGWSKGGLPVFNAIAERKLHRGDRNPVFKAAVAIYPFPDCPDEVANLETNLLVVVPEEDKEIFVVGCKRMKIVGESDAAFQRKIYPGVGHVFDMSHLPNYDEEAAADAAETQRVFFARYLSR